MSSILPPRRRSRLRYLFAALCIVALGLASRHLPAAGQALVGKYPGDALWASMVFFGLGALFIHASSLRLASGAFAFALVIELIKLYEAPWAVAVRHTTIGHLVFGHVFSWQNIVAYAVGVAIGLSCEVGYRRIVLHRHARDAA